MVAHAPDAPVRYAARRSLTPDPPVAMRRCARSRPTRRWLCGAALAHVRASVALGVRQLRRPLGLRVRRLGALPGPVLVELHAPFALLGLAQGQAGAKRAPAAPAKPRHRARRV